MAKEEMSVLKALDVINKAMIDCQKHYKVVYDEIGQKDLETIDYLHQLELNVMSEKEKRKWLKEMKKCRKDRRELKDRLEELAILKTLLEVPKIQNSIQTAINNLKRLEKHRENPVYNPRVIKDLEIRQQGKEMLQIEGKSNG